MRLSVTQVAKLAGVSRAYIKAEIERGNITAEKNATNAYEIEQAEYERWNTARRKNRTTDTN